MVVPAETVSNLSRRFFASAALTTILFVLNLPPLAQLLLAIVVLYWGGGLRFSLLGAGAAIAFLYSATAVFFPAAFSAGFRDENGALPLLFAPAALVISLALLDDLFELEARKIAPDEMRGGHAPLLKFTDLIAEYFAPAVSAAAAVAAGAWAIWGPEPRFASGLFAMIAVLVVASPAAFRIAGKLALAFASSRALRLGFRFRDAEAIERFRDADVIVLGKTGTITEGRPRVSAVKPLGMGTEDEVIALAASLESVSAHPLAKALVALAREWDLEISTPENFSEYAGRGVTAELGGKRYYVGNRAFLAEAEIDVGRAAATVHLLGSAALTVLFLADEAELLGLIGIADPVREEMRASIRELKQTGVEVVMLTGDGRATALAVARFAGIEDVVAEVLPEDKASAVRKLQKRGQVVAMAGDNPAERGPLARADVGIAFGKLADWSERTYGIHLLVEDGVPGITRARKFSRATVRNIRQGLAFASGYNLLAIAVAAGALFPAFGWRLGPVEAAVLGSAGFFLVLANALRLRRVGA